MQMNADERLKQREQISALADGQLSDLECAAVIRLASVDDDARACWQTYHLVGDVLRSGEMGAYGRDRDFIARLSTRLQAEPGAPRATTGILKDPESIADNDTLTLGSRENRQVFPPAANDSSFRWKLVAGFASLAAVAAISWSAIGLSTGASDGGRLARSGMEAAGTPAPVLLADAPPVSALAPVLIRDRRLDELMAAHRQAGGNSALQNPSGFLRNATFEGSSR